jgi:uncharacterized protein
MITHRFDDIREAWKNHSPSDAFLQFEFFSALETSGSIGERAGWIPVIVFQENAGLLYTFIKTHSYGEFIFDWEWARAYQSHGVSYYPKLTSMVPLTPVNNHHFIMKSFDEEKASALLKELESFYDKHALSSMHFLFLTSQEKIFFETRGFLIRESFQYHFENRYRSFDHYLSDVKGKKAKQLRREREFKNLTIRRFLGDEILREHAGRMYQFYLTTIEKKEGQAYLSEDFFTVLFTTMKMNLLYVEAADDEGPVAGSLFLFDEKRLYGRYWGSSKELPQLHFELCYYQGMDFCFERNIPLFEAGAQGEHKISRGFRPVKIYSAHRLKHPGFAEAIKNFVSSEKKYVDEVMLELSGRLPFKEAPSDE